jgi:hypothetical protein
LDEVYGLLKPNGFFIATVPCPGVELKEHFPDLYEYRILSLGSVPVLVNRKRTGQLEVTDRLAFHRGVGQTLEMRQLTTDFLHRGLLKSGFREVDFLYNDIPPIGIYLMRTFPSHSWHARNLSAVVPLAETKS